MMPTKNSLLRMQTCALLIMGTLLLSACGGGSGGSNNSKPAPPAQPGGNTFVYSGPAPANADIQRFQTAFYNNLVGDDRCGTCHTRGGQGKTAFVDRTDVNAAYNAALTLVNLENPAASAIVQKVYGGHNCWEDSPAACRVQMVSFIENWASGGGTVATTVKLAIPKDRDPNGADTSGDGVGDGFRAFPDLATYSGSKLYADVKLYCGRCHSETAGVQQQPYFASNDPTISFEAIKSKIDLNDPALSNATVKSKSRLVVRLRDEFHNCWSASCAADAITIQDDIQQLAANSPVTLLNSTIYRSKAQILNDGVVGSSGGRFELYQIALWRFLEGEGKNISDTSGVNPGITLTLKGLEGSSDDFNWIGGGGIQFAGAVAYGSAATSRKLYDLIAPGGEYSLEAWVLPANTTDEKREIISYGDGAANRNFMLGQFKYDYRVFNRSNVTNSRGEPFLSSVAVVDEGVLKSSLQHVVVTYDPVNGRRLYVNGDLASATLPDDRGTLANDWSTNYAVVLGNNLAQIDPNLAGSAAWKGALRMVSVHKRALSPQQINVNFKIPPGEKRYVMFNVSHLDGMPASCSGTDASGQTISYCFVYFEISQYDNYAYLFNKPYFISLNNDISDLSGLTIKGMHIGMNGKLSPVGQAYVHIDKTINTASEYTPGMAPGSGQLLSSIGTVVPKLSGADADLLYLEFDQIGVGMPAQVAPPTVLAFAYTLDGAPAIELGWRTFDSINASFSYLTDVPMSASTDGQVAGVKISQVFNGVRQQLPAVEDFPAYLSSHQTSVTQLAIAYCSALMHNSSYRQAFFGGGAASAAYLQGNGWDNLINPLVSKFLSGGGLYGASPSLTTEAHDELLELLTHSAADTTRKAGLCAAGGSCSSDPTILNAATVACAAALANAAITLQ
jgi:hypothetical protein